MSGVFLKAGAATHCPKHYRERTPSGPAHNMPSSSALRKLHEGMTVYAGGTQAKRGPGLALPGAELRPAARVPGTELRSIGPGCK